MNNNSYIDFIKEKEGKREDKEMEAFMKDFANIKRYANYKLLKEGLEDE